MSLVMFLSRTSITNASRAHRELKVDIRDAKSTSNSKSVILFVYPGLFARYILRNESLSIG